MNDLDLLRYSRHLLLNEWSNEVQNKLTTARVLIIGMGGLGCPAAQMLAAVGVGTLTLADGDNVDVTNLQRQLLHNTSRIGMAKVLSAQIALNDINPLCRVVPVPQRLQGANLLAAVEAHDIILDCSDNATTRYAINRACVAFKKPLVSGAAIRFEGQLIVFNANQSTSPCYHCLFPEILEPDYEDTDRCAVMGVFAPLTLQMGTLQATAAIKLITGVGRVTAGELLRVNTLTGNTHTVRVARDIGCMVCGTV
jgi:adenylyltransferase/sulfurtransferase